MTPRADAEAHAGRPADRGTDEAERGTTLTEVLVVLAITTLLAVPLLATVRTASRAQADQMGEADARLELDRALASMADDLRTGAPVASRPSGTRAADTVGIEVTDDSGLSSIVYWSVGRRGLRRFEADPTTRRIRSRSTLNAAMTPEVLDGAAPFRYFDATGRELDPLTVGLDRLAACTTLVEVTLALPVDTARADATNAVLTDTARHAVRTRPPGANGC